MRKHLFLAGVLVITTAAAGFAPHPSTAQDQPSSKAPQAGGTPPAQQPEAPSDQGLAGLSYTPPLRGAPGGRVGGASRGAIKPPVPLPTIDLLAPAEQAGETTSAAPTLYYFVSRPVSAPMQLTISAPLQPKPVLEVNIKAPQAPGIYPLRLADYRVRLEPGIVYTWSVSIILDPRAWSRNIVASAAILRAAPSAAAQGAAAAAGLRRVATFAGAGLWYDAIASAFDLGGPEGHAARDRLLQQVGLGEAARFDRTM